MTYYDVIINERDNLEKLILLRDQQHGALVAALDNFLAWIDSPDLEWGGVPETPELVALREALEAAK